MKEIINKLYYWYTIEKFSEFKVEINKEAYYEVLPWIEEEKEKNYNVYLGVYKNSDLVDFIIKTYGDKEGLHYAVNELFFGNINKTDSSN